MIEDELDFESQLNVEKVIIQVNKRNNRQSYTIITNIAEDLDTKRICKYLKKVLNCGGNVSIDEKTKKEIIRLTGDQKQSVIDFLINEEIYKPDEIIVKGL
jgi:translation initiation factor SUI1